MVTTKTRNHDGTNDGAAATDTTTTTARAYTRGARCACRSSARWLRSRDCGCRNARVVRPVWSWGRGGSYNQAEAPPMSACPPVHQPRRRVQRPPQRGATFSVTGTSKRTRRRPAKLRPCFFFCLAFREIGSKQPRPYHTRGQGKFASCASALLA